MNIPVEFKSMFREYDIRGRVSDKELNDNSVYDIVRAYATYLTKRNMNKAVVGYDNRTCSLGFAKATANALVDSGIDVYFIGLSLSPVVYFAQYHLECEGAVMITASHNPDGWSGFKMGKGYSKTLETEDIKEIFDTYSRQDFINADKKGIYKEVNVREAYINDVVGKIRINPEYKPRLVIDAGNGGAGVFAYEIFQRLGCISLQLNCDPDMTYPRYFPNPSLLEARKKLKEMIIHPYVKADLGLAFDGDGDRIGVLDEKGENVWSDKVLMLLAYQLLQKQKGAQIVFDVKCSQALIDVIKDNGGIPVMWITGNSYIKAKMQKIGAELAGERSGHIFIGGKDSYGYDDALFTAAKLVEYISYEKKPLSEILDQFPQYITSPEIDAYCADDVKYEIIDKLVEEFKAEYGDRVIDINGARVSFENGWGIVRASSNLPQIRFGFEAKTYEELLKIREIFRNKALKYPEISSDWENDMV